MYFGQAMGSPPATISKMLAAKSPLLNELCISVCRAPANSGYDLDSATVAATAPSAPVGGSTFLPSLSTFSLSPTL